MRVLGKSGEEHFVFTADQTVDLICRAVSIGAKSQRGIDQAKNRPDHDVARAACWKGIADLVAEVDGKPPLTNPYVDKAVQP